MILKKYNLVAMAIFAWCNLLISAADQTVQLAPLGTSTFAAGPGDNILSLSTAGTPFALSNFYLKLGALCPIKIDPFVDSDLIALSFSGEAGRPLSVHAYDAKSLDEYVLSTHQVPVQIVSDEPVSMEEEAEAGTVTEQHFRDPMTANPIQRILYYYVTNHWPSHSSKISALIASVTSQFDQGNLSWMYDDQNTLRLPPTLCFVGKELNKPLLEFLEAKDGEEDDFSFVQKLKKKFTIGACLYKKAKTDPSYVPVAISTLMSAEYDQETLPIDAAACCRMRAHMDYIAGNDEIFWNKLTQGDTISKHHTINTYTRLAMVGADKLNNMNVIDEKDRKCLLGLLNTIIDNGNTAIICKKNCIKYGLIQSDVTKLDDQQKYLATIRSAFSDMPAAPVATQNQGVRRRLVFD